MEHMTAASRTTKTYFAYGSNMDKNQMASRCPQTTLIAPGMLPGYRFMINSQGYATVIPEPGATVYGILWALNHPGEKVLDRYEGVQIGAYRKETINVVDLSSGQPRAALIYIAQDSHPGKPRKAYIDLILASAQRHKLPEHYIQELQSWKKTDE